VAFGGKLCLVNLFATRPARVQVDQRGRARQAAGVGTEDSFGTGAHREWKQAAGSTPHELGGNESRAEKWQGLWVVLACLSGAKVPYAPV
jgi:hypothetical protein